MTNAFKNLLSLSAFKALFGKIDFETIDGEWADHVSAKGKSVYQLAGSIQKKSAVTAALTVAALAVPVAQEVDVVAGPAIDTAAFLAFAVAALTKGGISTYGEIQALKEQGDTESISELIGRFVSNSLKASVPAIKK